MFYYHSELPNPTVHTSNQSNSDNPAEGEEMIVLVWTRAALQRSEDKQDNFIHVYQNIQLHFKYSITHSTKKGYIESVQYKRQIQI